MVEVILEEIEWMEEGMVEGMEEEVEEEGVMEDEVEEEGVMEEVMVGVEVMWKRLRRCG